MNGNSFFKATMRLSGNSSRVLLVGGGHSHVQILNTWKMSPIPGVELVMVSDVINTPYSGMLPGRLSGCYGDADMHFNLADLCAQAGAVFIHDAVVSLSAARRQAVLAATPPLYFDTCSLNVGLSPKLPPGSAGNARVVPVKPISGFLKHWHEMLDEIPDTCEQPWFVVGGGPAGFEISMALAMASCRANRRCDIHLLEAGDDILAGHGAPVRRRARKILSDWGVKVRTKCAVEKVRVQIAHLSGGIEETFDRMLVTTSGEAPGWFRNTDLTLSPEGFVSVDRFLQASPGVVFAAGDCAHFSERPLQKAGVFAVRQGPILDQNLRVAVSGEIDLVPYRPQGAALALMISGEGRALLSYGPFVAEGKWLWALKDRIDRSFMERFGPRTLEAAPAAMDFNSCGGCGGKVPAATLQAVLQALGSDPGTRALLPPEIEDVGHFGDTAVSVDGFRAFTGDLFFFGRVAVLHALNDLFASGAKPEGAAVMVTLKPAAERLRSNQLLHLMRGVLMALGENGARLLNAHTAEGDGVSLSITAIGAAGRRWSKKGLGAGQVLVLTKPLGVGALLQAEMRGRLAAAARVALHESLLTSHGPWVNRCSVPISAATDVSGFGLVGHLTEMMGLQVGIKPTGHLAVTLETASISALPEFARLEMDGVSAYLTAQNRFSFGRYVKGETAVHSSLFYDPQTNGPLLLAVAAADAERLIGELRASGLTAARIIGHVERSDEPCVRLI